MIFGIASLTSLIIFILIIINYFYIFVSGYTKMPDINTETYSDAKQELNISGFNTNNIKIGNHCEGYQIIVNSQKPTPGMIVRKDHQISFRCTIMRDEALDDLLHNAPLSPFHFDKNLLDFGNNIRLAESNGSPIFGDLNDGICGFVLSDGKASYNGHCKNGLQDGDGKMIFMDGTYLEGTWVNDYLEGNATYHGDNGLIINLLYKDSDLQEAY